MVLSKKQLAQMKIYGASIKKAVNSAEFTIELHAAAGGTLEMFDMSGPAHTNPILLLHTRDGMA